MAVGKYQAFVQKYKIGVEEKEHLFAIDTETGRLYLWDTDKNSDNSGIVGWKVMQHATFTQIK